MYSCQKADA